MTVPAVEKIATDRRFTSRAAEILAVASDRAWTRASHVAVVGLFVIGLIWCAYVAQHVLVPVLLAWTIATVLLPVVKWLQDHGAPRVVSAVTVTLVLLSLIIALLFLLSAPLGAR